MLCSNCQTEFNHSTNVPRILIVCGHTFCEACLRSQADKTPKSLECPDCKVASPVNDQLGIEGFPKNLVLLSVPEKKKPEVKESPTKKNRQPVQRQESKNCFKHGKKLEAFCEKDKEVLCIDCILSEQHKNHEITSAAKAVTA